MGYDEREDIKGQANSDMQVRSSFARCCNALSIQFEREQSPGPVYDASPAQKLREWLALRAEDQKWLVTLDNADTFDHLSRIVPWNKSADSVIVTSQDGKAAKPFPGARTLVIDEMEIEEAKTLLAQCMNISLPETHFEAMSLLEEVAHRLDGIALAVELAGACIRNDLKIRDHGQNADASERVVAGLNRYIADLEHHKKSMLSDSAYNNTSSYEKTIWNVWETVSSSFERCEKSDAEASAFPMHLLRLAALLGPDIIHRELFGSASQSLEEVCLGLSVDLPRWFKCLLTSTSYALQWKIRSVIHSRWMSETRWQCCGRDSRCTVWCDGVLEWKPHRKNISSVAVYLWQRAAGQVTSVKVALTFAAY
jgi:hypothetical protein